MRKPEEEKLYYPCSEKKGADQLRSYCEADLRLCFHIGKNLFVFFMIVRGLSQKYIDICDKTKMCLQNCMEFI